MIRLTEEMGRRLLQLLALPDLRAEINRNAGNPVIDIMGEAEAAIQGQLNTPNHFDDMIDTVVKLVTEPRISSLNGDYLRALRKALLSPLELATFNTMANKGQTCAGCGRTLHNYEAVTLHGRGIQCLRCATPETVTCHRCDQSIDAPGLLKTLERIMARHTCTPQQPEPEPASVTPGPSTPTTWTTVGTSSQPIAPPSISRATQLAIERERARQQVRRPILQPTQAQSRWLDLTPPATLTTTADLPITLDDDIEE